MFNRWAQIREILNTILKNIENAFALYFTFTEILWLTVHKLQLCSITLLQYFYQETVVTNEKKKIEQSLKKGERQKKHLKMLSHSELSTVIEIEIQSFFRSFRTLEKTHLGIRGNMSMGKNARSILSDYLVASS